MKKIWFIVLLFSTTLFGIFLLVLYDIQSQSFNKHPHPRPTFWTVQSVDTMKYSRDRAREALTDPSFDEIIDDTMKKIVNLGATHVAIDTPYDEEFRPVLKLWVTSARENNLKVWYRGNWAGWEQWFDYPRISREEHYNLTKQFILNNPELFENGDNFTACIECENGGPGDPRFNGDVYGHRKFLIDENEMMRAAFNAIGKQVRYNYNSMNGDVANLIMDKKTTAALGGVITIDHYVGSPEVFINDINQYIEKSEGRVVLGELGVPIPDIHGKMTLTEQADWLDEALGKLILNDKVIAVNYWVSRGGPTALWDENGTLKPIYFTLKKYYQPNITQGLIKNELGKAIAEAKITYDSQSVYSENDGYFVLRTVSQTGDVITVNADNYISKKLILNSDQEIINIILEKKNPGILYILRREIRKLSNQLLIS